MTIEIRPVFAPAEKTRLCRELAAELPKWFGPEADAKYAAGIAERDAFAGFCNGEPRGLVALDYPFGTTCNVWWLEVHPAAHRMGLGRALVERVAEHAKERRCRFLTVETVSPRNKSLEYEITRRFYEAVGFVPLLQTEQQGGDWMMWMARPL